MTRRRVALTLISLCLLYGIYLAADLLLQLRDPRGRRFLSWWQGNDATRRALVTAQRDACPDAPFVLPADGFIGLLYADPRGPYSARRPHQGIDIFSAGDPGVTPVYAAADGYVTRESNWVSSVIQRVPDDPLQPGRQIWLYYTHMADREGNSFVEPALPPGTRELYVEQGTLLGYTGDYNGGSSRTIWTHLHFSIVRDENGTYANELEFDNTLDPTPYLGMEVHYERAPAEIGCQERS